VIQILPILLCLFFALLFCFVFYHKVSETAIWSIHYTELIISNPSCGQNLAKSNGPSKEIPKFQIFFFLTTESGLAPDMLLSNKQTNQKKGGPTFLSVARVGPILFKTANLCRYMTQLFSSKALHSNFQCLMPTIVPNDTGVLISP